MFSVNECDTARSLLNIYKLQARHINLSLTPADQDLTQLNLHRFTRKKAQLMLLLLSPIAGQPATQSDPGRAPNKATETHPSCVVHESEPQAAFRTTNTLSAGSHSPSFWIQSNGPRLVQLLPEQNFPQRPVQLCHLDPIGFRICPVKFMS